MKAFLNDPRVIREIEQTENFIRENNLIFSDIADEDRNQYVDLVQEGGGVLGIGLIGYTYALEELKIRFYSLGGTSAGSINTILLGALATPNQKKSLAVLEILDSLDLMQFVDGGTDAKKIVNKLSEGASRSEIILTAFNQIDDFLIRKQKGINPGDNFYDWIKDILGQNGITTITGLEEKMNSFPTLFNNGKVYEPVKAKLAIVTSDITTQTKAVFPKMSELYFLRPEEINPAFFVRASMSIPVFFEPLTLEELPDDRETILKWQNNIDTAYLGTIPNKITFVDGGVLSNFPIDEFHVLDREPTRPTFGVKLGFDRIAPKENNSVFQIIMNSFSAARQLRDFEVIAKNPDFVNLIAPIDDSDINWLDFKLPESKKVLLFVRGVQAACKFLREFKWNEYKNIRRKLLDDTSKSTLKIDQRRFIDNFIRKLK